MIDARLQYNPDPDYIAGLIDKAVDRVGTLKGLAKKIGVSRRHLYNIKDGERVATFAEQVILEDLINGR